MKKETDFLVALKEQTNDIHNKAHSLEYFQSLIKGSIDIKSYLTQLHALAIVFAALEREMQKIIDRYPKLLPDGYVNKLPFLLDDIHYISSKTDERVLVDVIKKALKVTDDIMLLGAKEPLLLLGYLYTLEGSLQGGKIVKEHFKKKLNLDSDKGTKYLFCYGNNTDTLWNEFKTSFSKLIVQEQKEKEIIETSSRAFESLINIYSGIHNVTEQDLGYHSAAFNPEAGEHELPHSDALIHLAKESNKICWYEFPYYEHRYKEKGFRFGLTDNLWLLNFIDSDFEIAKQQILWLTKVLCGRGMPSMLMEKQLRILDKLLRESKNIQNENHQNFLKIAQVLAKQRAEILSDEKVDELIEAFEKTSDMNINRKLRNATELIICSVIDEKTGYVNSIESLKAYMCDKSFFTKEWIRDVENLYKKVEYTVS